MRKFELAKKLDNLTINSIKALSETGSSQRAIASRLDVNPESVSKYSKMDGAGCRESIERLKEGIRSDLLRSAQKMTALNETLTDELASRDYTKSKPEMISNVLRSVSISSGIALQRSAELAGEHSPTTAIALFLEGGSSRDAPAINPIEARHLAESGARRLSEKRDRDSNNAPNP